MTIPEICAALEELECAREKAMKCAGFECRCGNSPCAHSSFIVESRNCQISFRKIAALLRAVEVCWGSESCEGLADVPEWEDVRSAHAALEGGE